MTPPLVVPVPDTGITAALTEATIVNEKQAATVSAILSRPYNDAQIAAARQSLRNGHDRFVDEEFARDTFAWGILRKTKVHWKRIHELSVSPALFDPTIDALQVRQGRLGDCFFIAALTLLCSDANSIRKLFVTPEINDEGLYCLQFFMQGAWQRVVIDDYLPTRRVVHKATGAISYRLILGRCTNASIFWVSLVEKAYAKLYGSYRAIAGGNVSESLVDLTGSPVHDYSIDRPEFQQRQFWATLLAQHRAGFLVGCAMCVKPSAVSSDDDVNETAAIDDSVATIMGIQANHAYSVQRILRRTIDTIDRRLLLVKNPQGAGARSTFAGVFRKRNANDDETGPWTEAARAALDYDALRPGMFWMTWKEFRTEFNRVYSCDRKAAPRVALHGSWTEATAGGCNDHASWRNNPVFEVDGDVSSVSLQQIDRRLDADANEDDSSISYPMIGITIVRRPVPSDNPFLQPSPAAPPLNRTSFWNKRDVAAEILSEWSRPLFVVPSTHEPQHTGDFIIYAHAAGDSVVTLRATTSSLCHASCCSEWAQGSAGGGPSVRSFSNNPKFMLRLVGSAPDPSRPLTVFVGLRQITARSSERNAIGIVVLRKGEYALDALQGSFSALAPSWFEGKSSFSNHEEVSRVLELNAAAFPYMIIPCTWTAGALAQFELVAYWRPSELPDSSHMTLEIAIPPI